MTSSRNNGSKFGAAMSAVRSSSRSLVVRVETLPSVTNGSTWRSLMAFITPDVLQCRGELR